MAEPKIGGGVKVALIAAAALLLIGVVASTAVVTVPLVPLIYLLLLYAMTRVPLRHSMMTLMFFAFTLENPDEGSGCGVFKSPFYEVGDIVLTHLNSTDRSITALSFMSFSGMDVLLVSLVLIAMFRKLTGSKIDGAGFIATPAPLVKLAFVSLFGIGYVWVSGIVRGGDFRMSLWQLDRVMYLPIVFLLFQRALRGPTDHFALARVVLTAAAFRALLAVYIINTVRLPGDPASESTKLPYATSHHDSMLFATAFVMLLALVMERAGRRFTRLAVVLLPVLIAGMIANGRRMAWVQIAVVFVTVYWIAPDNRMKKALRKGGLFTAPLLAGYTLVGWNSGSSIFRPVQMIRSVVDAQTDASTLWREFENFDLIATIRLHPIFGTGYGNGYAEIIKLPEINYELERFAPHNSVLGLWAFCGVFGYTAITLLWIVGVYFAIRAYHSTKEPTFRVAAQVCLGSVLIYMVQCWGDLGLGTRTGVFLVAPAIAVAGKLAVATGQWGKQKGKKAAQTSVGGPAAVRGAEQTA